jgi:hypothetical protein
MHGSVRGLSMIVAATFACLLHGPVTPVHAGQAVVLGPKYKVRAESLFIPMRDGTKLHAPVARPDADGRFAALITYDPYRGTAANEYFAKRGFVTMVLNARGTGGSEGFNTDEYRPIEQQDGYDAVEWVAAQPWCNGNVGMYGTSYSGFTSIQVAVHRPPHLKAIIPMYATDDRYTDDCHYTPGGNMRMYYDTGSYGGWMIAMNAMPPFDNIAEPEWSQMWKMRLEKSEPYLLKWMKQQVDGPYWRNGSLRPDYERVQCPVFLIAGWQDGYPNAMLRLYANLNVPKKLLIGPWVHTQPHASVPGPRIDWMNEAARFFAHWLRDEDTGIMNEPPVAVYLQEYATPKRTAADTPGHWRNESSYPVPGTTELIFYLEENGRLSRQPGGTPRQPYDEFAYRPAVGIASRYWSGGGIPYYLADDQRADEAFSLVYTSEPLEEELRVFGWPKAVLHACSSSPVATFVVKLAVVSPDGHSALVTDGSLNATRRESLTDPQPLAPGEIYELDVPVWPTGWVLKPGQRLRVAIASSDFPNLWPTPYKATNRIYRGGAFPSRITLPLIPQAMLPPPAFVPSWVSDEEIHARLAAYEDGSPLRIIHDQITGMVTAVKEGTYRCFVSSDDPAQSGISATHTVHATHGADQIEARADVSIRGTQTDFHIHIDLKVSKNGEPFFNKTWTATEPRRLL